MWLFKKKNNWGPSTWPFIICASLRWSWNLKWQSSQFALTNWLRQFSIRSTAQIVCEVGSAEIPYTLSLCRNLSLTLNSTSPCMDASWWPSPQNSSLAKETHKTPEVHTCYWYKIIKDVPQDNDLEQNNFVQRIEALVLQSLIRKMFCDQGNPSS